MTECWTDRRPGPEVRVTDDGVVIDAPENKVAYTQVMNDPNCFTFQKMFPGGFTPQFGSYILDASMVAGLKGTSGDLNWDASASWGKSNLDFYMYNTVNASLGPDQPCADESRSLSFVVPNQPCTPWFNPGIYDQQEVNVNLDLSYALTERVNVAGGGEWRNERFEIIKGNTESWTEGPLATQGFTPGSNGFTGFGPLTEGDWNRDNFAVYGDMEIREPEGAWTRGVAGRVERFSDFGTTVNGKISGRVSASETVGLRGSVSTGFRAPTPGQQNAFNITTIYDPAIMDLTNNGTIPSTSPLAVNFGGEALRPETSVNLALGAVYDKGPFSLSMDLFQIRLSDRLTTSADYPARILFDAETARTFGDRWTLTIGAQNVFNTYPEEYPGAAAGVGNRFGQFTPFGFNGGFYYTRLSYGW